MEERIIILRDLYGKEIDIYIKTNAPKEEIQKALSHRCDMREQMLYDDVCDFEIIQNYLQEKGYSFYDFDIEEKYYW